MKIKEKRKKRISKKMLNLKEIHFLLKSLWSMLLITVPAIYRFCTIRYKRNFTFFPTICTGRFMHFSWCAPITTASFVSIHIYYFLILRLY